MEIQNIFILVVLVALGSGIGGAIGGAFGGTWGASVFFSEKIQKLERDNETKDEEHAKEMRRRDEEARNLQQQFNGLARALSLRGITIESVQDINVGRDMVGGNATHNNSQGA